MFRFAIVRFDLKTPGRESAITAQVAVSADGRARGPAFARALGGSVNVVKVDACTTRLRLEVRDPAAVDGEALRALGARGIVRPGAGALQVVLGPQADQVAGEIRAALREGGEGDLATALRALAPKSIRRKDGRLLLTIGAAAVVDIDILKRAGARGVWRCGTELHVLAGPAAEALEVDLSSTAG